MLSSRARRYAAQHRVSLPVLVGPARGARVVLSQTGLRNFASYVMGGYERDTVRFLAGHLRKARVFADIGAMAGYYTRVALSELSPGGVVVAFEPHPRGREHLRAIAGRAKGRQVVIRDEPLGERDTDAPFAFGRGTGYATAHEQLRSGYEERTVRFRSLDSLIAEGAVPAPDVAKIDVEGLETEVLLGMRRLLEASHPALAVECHGLGTLSSTLGVLEDVGYRDVIVARERPHVGPWHVLTGPDWASRHR